MKYIIYAAVAVLILWAVVYLIRNIRRQLRGKCSACGGDCSHCSGCGTVKK
ncbi:MAG: FeoB-associated Cys-rich membrane protein [Pseudoflavonifractor sp.]